MSLSPRSTHKDRKPWWLLLFQTLALLTSISVLAWLQTLPPDRLREAIHQRLGNRRMQLLKTSIGYIKLIVWETFVFLSCFSPLYAVWFWWMFRKRMNFSSIVALTYIGGAFSVYYVYGARVVGRSQRRRRERDWQVDAQSVEQQVWTTPDGMHVTKICEKSELAGAVASDFRGGRMRIHR